MESPEKLVGLAERISEVSKRISLRSTVNDAQNLFKIPVTVAPT